MCSYSAKVSAPNIFQLLMSSVNDDTIYDSLGLTQSSSLKVRLLPPDAEFFQLLANFWDQSHLFQTHTQNTAKTQNPDF